MLILRDKGPARHPLIEQGSLGGVKHLLKQISLLLYNLLKLSWEVGSHLMVSRDSFPSYLYMVQTVTPLELVKPATACLESLAS